MKLALFALATCLLRLVTVSPEHAIVAGWVLWALLVFYVFNFIYPARGR